MRKLPFGIVGLALLGATVAAPAASGVRPAVKVMRDVRAASADVPLGKVTYPIDAAHPQPDTQIEPSIAVNPSNPLNAVAVYQEDRVDNGGDAGNGFTTTFDGGKHWVHGYLPGLTRYTGGTFDRASDAVVTFGADPRQKGHFLVYANSLVFNDGSGPSGDSNSSGMAVNVSKDGGRHWSKAVILEQDGLGGLNDKNWIVADNGTGAGHTTGRVYLVWDRVSPMVYTYCDSGCDQLSNWANATSGNSSFYVYDPEPGIGSIPLVLPNGDLGVVFQGDFGGSAGVEEPAHRPARRRPGGRRAASVRGREGRGQPSVPGPADVYDGGARHRRQRRQSGRGATCRHTPRGGRRPEDRRADRRLGGRQVPHRRAQRHRLLDVDGWCAVVTGGAGQQRP